jgi:D-3-phosphoglycerate dehydrogenase
MTEQTIIFDFDSTFVKCETLDSLVKIIYHDSPDLDKITREIESATHASMSGMLSIHEALVSRVKALQIEKQHVLALIDHLKQQVSESFLKNRAFIEANASDIFVFSGGFSEVIIPVVADFNIPADQVFANRFVYDANKVIGIEEDCPLAHNFGKAKQLDALNRSGLVYILGDGATDAEMKTAGEHVKFYLYAENILRENLIEKADKVIYSLDEFKDEIEESFIKSQIIKNDKN